eukprot:gene10957-3665_t
MEKEQEKQVNTIETYFSNIKIELSSNDPWSTIGDAKTPIETKKQNFEYDDEEYDKLEKVDNQKTGKYSERYSGKSTRNKVNKLNF